MARRFVIVPAAGGGSRFGGALRKQYADLAGVPVVGRTLDQLRVIDAESTIVALAADDDDYARLIGSRAGVEALPCGGATRAATVRNALAHLAPRVAPADWILVHDAARPCVPHEALLRLLRELDGDAVGGLLAVPVADTLKRAERSDTDAPSRVLRTEDRGALWQAQTPQMFRQGILAAALARDTAAAWSDEAQAVEALAATGACTMPRLVLGDPANVKLTYAADLALATAIVAMQRDGSAITEMTR
ncbi:MAG: 2-C-methyl-D-erythritol 4-phosphate cytidylyltransferase [Casimicrobiaceae bacterium]